MTTADTPVPASGGSIIWKRRRAARKFEVYMRDHDRTVTFDEHGNYIPPDDDKKNGGSKSGWVN